MLDRLHNSIINDGLYETFRKGIRKITGFSTETNRELDRELTAIRKEVETILPKSKAAKQKVMMMSFSIYQPCQVHDFLLSQVLRLRGAEIVPLICGGLQEGPCSSAGGFWGGYSGDEKHDVLQKKRNCENCIKEDRILWEQWVGVTPINLAKYLDDSEKQAVEAAMDSFEDADYKKWSYENMPVGQWGLDVLRNNALVGDETLIENYIPQLKGYLKNIILMTKGFKKVLDLHKPDIIVSNDSYYYPWSILEKLAAKMDIPFYSHWSGGRRAGWCYAKGESAMALNLSEPWRSWKHKELLTDERKLINDFLDSRRTGKTMILNTADPTRNISPTDFDQEMDISFNKPTALLAANVIWDLAALDKEIQFKNMIDWIYQVIDFFEKNPQWQLIIKAHPAEKNQYLPQTKQAVWEEISKHKSVLPENIRFLSPTSKTSFYDLVSKLKVGLVFTSTVGLEMACQGIPVITAGHSPYRDKGFTYDTETAEDYFQTLTSLLEGDTDQQTIDRYSELAKKFFYLYYFRYYSSLNLFDYSYTDKPKLLISGADGLIPGVNSVLDYVCDSILDHLPIVSENRWPPKQ